MLARLSIRSPVRAEYVLRGDAVVSLGRSLLNGIVLGGKDDGAVSRFHAAIIPLADGALVLQDLGSRNGLLVNGEPAAYRYLVNQDTICIGDNILTYEQSDDERISAPPKLVGDLSLLGTRTRLSALPAAKQEEIGRLLAQPQYAAALYRIIRAVSIQSDFGNSCGIAASELLAIMGFTRAVAVLVDHAGSPVCCALAIPQCADTAIPKPLLAEVAAKMNPVMVDAGDGNVSAVCIPVCSQARIEAAIYLDAGGAAKPLTENDRLLVKVLSRDISAVLERQRLLRAVQKENAALHGQLSAQWMMAGNSPALVRALADARMYGATDVPLIVRGETGTGKELIAHDVHRHSSRSGGIFLGINCAAIPESVLESELFGVAPEYPGFHSKEGLTGKIRLAEGGTLFLDEIGDMSPALQAKILRFLDEKAVWPLGAKEPVKVDVRIIAATNRDIRDRIKNGAFREDLYQRLAVAEIVLPPLRERLEDIPVLAGFFLARLREKYGALGRLSPASVDLLSQYSWPGNVRELRNAVERAAIRAASAAATEIQPNHFAAVIALSAAAAPSGELLTLKEMEKRHIARVLEHTGGNKEQAYKILGISRASLFGKIKHAGIECLPPAQ